MAHAKPTNQPTRIVRGMTDAEKTKALEFLHEARSAATEAIDSYQTVKDWRRRPELANSIRYWQNVRSGIDWLIKMMQGWEWEKRP